MFDPELYREFRPSYPAALFAPLLTALNRSPHAGRALRLADLGCGTGLSAASVVQALAPRLLRLNLVEPDASMLGEARGQALLVPHLDQALTTRAEATALPDASQDLVLIGSALHWMDIPTVAAECVRILAPGGLLQVFEYQFPKATDQPALNEWIRREFNLKWRAPGQVPRGDFPTLARPLSEHPGLERLGGGPVPMQLELQAHELAGHIFSQSRYLHYERALGEAEKQESRRRVLEQLQTLSPRWPVRLDFKLQHLLFRKLGAA